MSSSISRLIPACDYNAAASGWCGLQKANRTAIQGKGDPSMPDEAVSLRDINWRETFPFTHIFRAFRIAIHPSKLILALVALGCLWLGGSILDSLWNKSYQVVPQERAELGFLDGYLRIPKNINPLGNLE